VNDLHKGLPQALSPRWYPEERVKENGCTRDNNRKNPSKYEEQRISTPKTQQHQPDGRLSKDNSTFRGLITKVVKTKILGVKGLGEIKSPGNPSNSSNS
jgi:hypothetical protein